MTTEPSQNAINVQVPEGFDLRVEFMGAGGQLCINGQAYAVNEMGLVVPANDQQKSNLAQRVLEVGQRLRDGTVVLSVDIDKNEALFVPEKIFGGKANFDHQNDVVAFANRAALHCHTDWRRIADHEGDKLANNWAKVTTQDPEWFWLAAPGSIHLGRVRRGGEPGWFTCYRSELHLVPVVRSGPALVLDI
ncbi:MAG: hypothetical protein PHX61_11980 [Alphaproteobacteria bacterium]|nr:hypothetical protein [Alphaproteobacteria bacterium]